MSARSNGGKVVCECLGITEDRVLDAIRREGLTTVKQVTACTEAGGGCTSCHPAIRAYLTRLNGRDEKPPKGPVARVPYSSSFPNFSAK